MRFERIALGKEQVGAKLVDGGCFLFKLGGQIGKFSASRRQLGLVPRAVRALKKELPELCVITDIALDPYNSDGHDGLVSDDGVVLNDETVALLCKQALAHAEAGADLVAPSDMMDGRVGALRDALDAAGLETTSILSYAAKFASAYYGPFREAAHSAPGQGDRRGYQADLRNARDAVRDALLDEDEGADLLMVKPAITSLDLIGPITEATGLPVGAYQVSGEYASLVALAERGLTDFDRALAETWHVLRRAGAAFVITYGARRAKAIGLA